MSLLSYTPTATKNELRHRSGGYIFRRYILLKSFIAKSHQSLVLTILILCLEKLVTKNMLHGNE